MEFLICTNGSEDSWPAIEYGAWVAASIEAPVILLGIAEHLPANVRIDEKYPLEDMFGRAVELFQQRGLKFSLEIQNGDAERIIPGEADKRDRVTVIGRLARARLRRLLAGRSIRYLMERIRNPILYVPKARLPLRKMLVCLGGLGYEVTAEHLAIRIGIKSNAEVTLLHVAPPVDLDYPTARAEREHWRDLVDTNTLPGRNLRMAVETAREAGLSAQVKARQGNIIEEILAEIAQGDYDLVCMGSAYGSHGLRHMYGPNVTDEVAERAACPVLTARFAP
jgi:nucleotide-binding universal stress UspA family protein